VKIETESAERGDFFPSRAFCDGPVLVAAKNPVTGPRGNSQSSARKPRLRSDRSVLISVTVKLTARTRSGLSVRMFSDVDCDQHGNVGYQRRTHETAGSSVTPARASRHRFRTEALVNSLLYSHARADHVASVTDSRAEKIILLQVGSWFPPHEK
jgi:hypothetical protein